MARKFVSPKIMGRKRGMMQIFDEKGEVIPCTVIEAEPNVITQIKTEEIDGYNAIQTGFDKVQVKDARTIEKRVSRPRIGHFKKAQVEPRRFLTEFRIENPENYTVGQEITLELLNETGLVDVTAISKGKGYQGVIKLHNYSGGPASHGSGFHRHAGSTGMRSTPGRCLPGGPRPSHMGSDRITVQNLEVVKIQDNLILIKGAVPGPRNGLVYIAPAVKKNQSRKTK